MPNNVYIPESAMAIVAHPDDIEFSCSGTMARWAQAGARISYVLCTSGDVGIDEPGMTRERATEIREAEQREAARLAGASEVIFLREPDGMLQATMDLRRRLVREIRRFRPEVVVCGDPTIVWAGNDYINHPDHRAAATAALDAIFPAAGQPNLFQELEQEGIYAYKPRKVYVTSWDGADVFVNITETIEIKIAALRAHKSQMKEWDPEESIKRWAAGRAQGKEMAYAEGYRQVTLVDDETWAKTKGRVNGGVEVKEGEQAVAGEGASGEAPATAADRAQPAAESKQPAAESEPQTAESEQPAIEQAAIETKRNESIAAERQGEA